MSAIYVIKNNKNSKVYIGQTTRTVRERFQQHLLDAKNEKYSEIKFYRAIRKYGEASFYYEILIEGDFSKDELDELEQKYIAQYSSFSKGYNSTTGGGSFSMTDEVRKKISRAVSGKNHPFYGKKRPIEHRANISAGKLAENNPKYIKIDEKELEIMRKMRQNGSTYKEIGEQFGISYSTAKRKILGISRSKY